MTKQTTHRLKKLWKVAGPLIALARLIPFLVELAHHL
jgi:hypothetical protein